MFQELFCLRCTAAIHRHSLFNCNRLLPTAMVRFKNRYLLFEIIYADTPLGWTSIPTTASSAFDSSSQSNSGSNQNPFGDTGRHNCRLPPLANKDLVYAIKDSIAENFGDYGAGITQRPMTCKNLKLLRTCIPSVIIRWH